VSIAFRPVIVVLVEPRLGVFIIMVQPASPTRRRSV